MPKERNAFRLGLTLIVFIALFVVVLVLLAPGTGGDLRLVVRFPHSKVTSTLKPGGDVLCGGDVVGTIRSVRLEELPVDLSGPDSTRPAGDAPATPDGSLPPQTDLYTVLVIDVDSSIGLRANARIEPRGALLGGMGYLVISHRGVGDPLDPGRIINGRPEAGLMAQLESQFDPDDPNSLLSQIRTQLDPAQEASLMSKVHRSLDDINEVTLAVRNELDGGVDDSLKNRVHEILANINAVTVSVRDEMNSGNDAAFLARLHGVMSMLEYGLENLAGLIVDNRKPITETIARVRSTSEIVELQIARRIAEQLDPNEPATLLAKVHVSLDRFGASLQDIRGITSEGREVVALTKPRIIRMVDNLKSTSDHLEATSKDLRRSPWRLFYQPTVAEAENANVFDAAREFSEAASQLDDAVTRLESLMESDLVQIRDDPKLLELLDQLQNRFLDFSEAEDALWEQLKIR